MGKLWQFLGSILDPRAWMQVLRLVHYYNYAHAAERRKINMGHGVQFSPNVSLRNGERISIGDGAHIGERCSLWAGESTGRIEIRDHALFGPDVYITASNYEIAPGQFVMDQPKVEEDVVIGRDVWLGARVIVVAGVQIGDGCVVGAGSVVTRDLSPGSIAVGAPARVVGQRGEGGSGARGEGAGNG